jgi:hypothetical protein
MAMRHGADRPLAARDTGMGPRHIGLDPSLVDEDEMLRLQARLVFAPCRARRRDVRPVLLGGVECLFLRVRPKADR